MKFSEFAHHLEKIEQVSSRLEITRLLSELLKQLHPDEIAQSLYLMQGRIAPQYVALEFGMAEKMVSKSAQTAMNIEKKYFETELKKLGDIGQAVEQFKKQYASFDQEDLEIVTVFDHLEQLAKESGKASQERKGNILAQLIRQLDPRSCRFLVRIPLGALRIGFSDMTVLDALSWMVQGDKGLRSVIEQAYHVRPDIGYIAQLVKKDGVSALRSVRPEVFTPILMMRAERLSSGQEIIDKIGRCSVESKYDGFRLQIHLSNREVKLYSRSLEDMTYMYPDIVSAVLHRVTVKSAIFEGEAIGYDPMTQKLLPFQETVQRKRKHDIEEKAKEIPLRLFVFDLLYLDGKRCIDEPFQERRKRLSQVVRTDSSGTAPILLAADNIVDDPQEIEQMFDEAIAQGLEGILAKKLDGVYQAGARGWNWIKFKRSYSSKIDDTIDCLVMGYDYGKGKRTAFGIGAFLVGVYDEKLERFVTAAKIGTGLTDDEWRRLKKESDQHAIKTKPEEYEVHKLMHCDVWVKPKIVVEIKADELTKSPTHTAEYALRFPRLERFRTDKKPEDATSLNEYRKMFEAQKK